MIVNNNSPNQKFDAFICSVNDERIQLIITISLASLHRCFWHDSIDDSFYVSLQRHFSRTKLRLRRGRVSTAPASSRCGASPAHPTPSSVSWNRIACHWSAEFHAASKRTVCHHQCSERTRRWRWWRRWRRRKGTMATHQNCSTTAKRSAAGVDTIFRFERRSRAAGRYGWLAERTRVVGRRLVERPIAETDQLDTSPAASCPWIWRLGRTQFSHNVGTEHGSQQAVAMEAVSHVPGDVVPRPRTAARLAAGTDAAEDSAVWRARPWRSAAAAGAATSHRIRWRSTEMGSATALRLRLEEIVSVVGWRKCRDCRGRWMGIRLHERRWNGQAKK